jgi:hypothetical protein
MWREVIFVKKLSTNGTEGITKISMACRLRLTQLVKFFIVESIHPGLNPIFDLCVIFMINYSFNGRRCSRRQQSDGDFINLNISRSSLSEVIIGGVCVGMQVC